MFVCVSRHSDHTGLSDRGSHRGRDQGLCHQLGPGCHSDRTLPESPTCPGTATAKLGTRPPESALVSLWRRVGSSSGSQWSCMNRSLPHPALPAFLLQPPKQVLLKEIYFRHVPLQTCRVTLTASILPPLAWQVGQRIVPRVSTLRRPVSSDKPHGEHSLR